MRYLNLINNTLKNLLIENDDLFIIGEDIIDPYGGAFRRGRQLYKPQKKKGYFIFPSVRDRLPEMQRDYVRRLNKLVIALYGKASATGSSRKLTGKS